MTTSKHPTSQIKNSTNPELQTMNNPTQTYNQNLQKLTHPNPPNFIIARTIPAIVNLQIKKAPKKYFAGIVLAIKRNIKRTNNYQPTTINFFGGIPPPKLWQGTG